MKNTMIRLLAVFAVTALGVACGSVSPSAPNDPLAGGDEAALSVGPTSKALAPRPCRNLASVKLEIVPSVGGNVSVVHVRARYHFWGPGLDSCAAPAWTANRRGSLSVDKDPFQAWVSLQQYPSVTVTATAPNGLADSLVVTDR